MRRLGFGFIGAGEIAVATARSMAGAEHAVLRRVADARADLAADMASMFGAQVATIDELLADPAVDAVYIATPHMLHRPLALQAAAAGKHVLVEKPMGVDPDDARAIVAACRAQGVACGVPFVVRYAPAYREAFRLVQSGAIGAVTGFRIVYRGDKPASYWTGGYSGRAASDWRQHRATAGGGVMIMNAIHDLDSLLWITGLQVEHVSGLINDRASPGDVEDSALAILGCSGGALGSIEALAALPGGQGPDHPWNNRIYGEYGQIRLPTPWGSEPLSIFTRESAAWRELRVDGEIDPRQQAIDEFAAAVLDGQPVPIPGEDCLRASTIMHAVYRSAQIGGRVTLADSGI